MSSERQALAGGRAKKLYDQFKARASRDDEFSDWAGYRGVLTEFVVNSTRPGSSLLILGAGRCNDLDLRTLAGHCGRITLSDYRPEIMEEALCRYGLPEASASEQIGFLQSDYVGIPDEAYLQYTERLLETMETIRTGQGESLEEIAGPRVQKLQECLQQIYRDNEGYEIDLGDAVCDNAVVAGVHSQLNNSFRGLFQYVLKDVEEHGGPVKFAEELNAAVFAETRKHTRDLVLRFNDAVFAAVREGVVYGYEKNIIYTPAGENVPTVGTVDGARQAGEAVANHPVENRMGCLWPLSRRRGIKFEMEIRYLRV